MARILRPARNGDRLFELIGKVRGLLDPSIRGDFLWVAACVRAIDEGCTDQELESKLREYGWRGNLEQLGWLRLAYDMGRGCVFR